MNFEEELTKLALIANAAIQDVQSLADGESQLSKTEVSSKIAKARSCILSFKEKIEEVNANAKIVDKETDRVAMEVSLKHWRQELSRLNSMVRRVNLAALSIIEKQEKSALMVGGESTVSRRKILDKQAAAKGSSSVTQSLVSTSKMMAEHLQRSNDTIETLANSSKGITSTNEELKNMQGHIKNSRSLLTKYGRKENTDKIFIFLAFVFFLATVLYILKKRLWSSYSASPYNPPQDHSQEGPITI